MDEGARSANPGFEAIRGSLGPMGRSVDDLEVAMRVLLDASAKLYRTLPLVPIPFREVTLPAKLKVGYYLTGQHIPPWRFPSELKASVLQMDSCAQVRRVGGPSSRRSTHFASEGTSASSSLLLVVCIFTSSDVNTGLIHPRAAMEGMELFVALTSAGGCTSFPLTCLRGLVLITHYSQTKPFSQDCSATPKKAPCSSR